MDALDTLIERWSAIPDPDLGLQPPVSVEVISQTFRDLGGHATTDVLDLYTRLGGMAEMDDELWRLWSLEELVSENTKPSPYGLLFSDYLVSCWCYRLKAVNDEVSEVYVDTFESDVPPKLVARSLSEFFAAYVRDPNSVLYP